VADVPPGLTTVTSIVPADSLGSTAVMLVEELTVNELAATVPKSTTLAPEKFVPVIVTDVPPAVPPRLGLVPLTVGAAW